MEYRENTNLKSANVEVISIESTKDLDWLLQGVSRKEGDAHIHQSLHSVRPKQTQVPSNNGSPIMSNHEHRIGAHGVQNSDEVADHVETGVAAHIRRRVAVAVTTEVRSQGSVAEGGESVDLVAPGVP